MIRTSILVALLTLAAKPAPVPAPAAPASFEALVTLFKEWRAFQKPPVTKGVPDYSTAAMQTQQKQIAVYRQKLAAIDTAGWTIPQRVDYTIVWAEINGLDFDHRVLRPWEKNPAFYAMVFGSQSDQPAREGPHVEGIIEVWQYQFPLSATAASELTGRIKNIPAVYTQAKQNLTGNTKDLWTGSLREYDGQLNELDRLSKRLAGKNPGLDSAVQAAKAATTEFRGWIQKTAASKTGPSGIGIENYNWYLKNVLLLPYTWQDQVTM